MKRISIVVLSLLSLPLAYAGGDNDESKSVDRQAVQVSTASCSASTSTLSPLFHDICHGNETQFFTDLALFKASEADPFKVLDGFGLGPLHWAASLGNYNIVRALVDAGFSPSQLGGKRNRVTPIHSAIKGNHQEAQDKSNYLQVIQYLVEQGKADLTIKNSDGRTPLQLAEELQLAEVIGYLQDRVSLSK